MSKVICDVCGTTYPETAQQCPICGCAKNTTAQTVAGEAGENFKRALFYNAAKASAKLGKSGV